LATNTFKDLMELSFNVEPRFSGPIIQSASSILGHAVTAKMAKIDKKLKMVDLQLKKARLDKTTKEPTEGKEVNGEGILLDRNTLLKEILANSSKN
jgi:predicted CoA-binding protein